MKLNIAERIALLGVLPQEGSFVTLKIVRDLQGQLSFSEEELKHFNIKNTILPDGRANISWNPKLINETKDINIGEMATNIITEQLKSLDQQKQLHITMIPLYERFVDGKN